MLASGHADASDEQQIKEVNYMQNIELIGNLTKDPIKGVTPKGTTAVSFTVASNRYSPEKEQLTDFFRCSVYGKAAENCALFLKKGSKVYVHGELRPSRYVTPEKDTLLFLDIHADTVQFLSPKTASPKTGFEPVDEESALSDFKSDTYSEVTEADEIPF